MVAPLCDTKCGDAPGGGAGGGVVSATKIDNPEQIVQPGVLTDSDFTSVVFDVGPAITPDLAGNALVINQDGLYELIASETWLANGGDVVFATAIAVNGVILVSSSISDPQASKAGTLSALVELSAGARVTVQLLVTGGNSATFGGTIAAYKL